ncbi:Fpg/Nei family DNA glycosylase [Microbacterium paludicola]|uniref:Fpg/Nei family DNA glycosylase n=1 Tax=Microbacterium paludicola TaxID=300019 RepID=A0A4Y9FTS7_9MICO|nr:DNA-formamidopyrimidine glycosylase family protein [Microbacterium paludicola]MBF0816603.1 Fpg/Nei family DNA glycosylase [Microbacterium paludicola]TFU32690.1 Fpg/Nei family DNA glycosylase [Microbacterium paludicola]
MPESPEVDALAGFVRANAVGRVIREVELEEFRALKTRARPLTELSGRTLAGVRRFGKHVALDTDGPSLLIGFGRAGWARWAEEPGTDPDEAPPVIVRVTFEDGAELALTDAGDWLSLNVSVTDDATSEPSVAKLGPDPLSDAFTREAFDGIAKGRRKQLKALLQEQESLAGIGNAYSDEILHAAKLSPVAHAASLTDAERDRLYAAIRDILGGAFAARRDVPLDRQKAEKVAAMRVHGRTGEVCPVCGDEVRDVPASKGNAQYCATCQTGGVPLEG